MVEQEREKHGIDKIRAISKIISKLQKAAGGAVRGLRDRSSFELIFCVSDTGICGCDYGGGNACDNLEILRAYFGDRNCGAAHGNCAESDVAYVSVYADEPDADHDVPKAAYEESNLL